jgi:ASPIC and UnbV
VGLGAATRVEAVAVRWIDGVEERFGPFDADRIVTVRRGTGTALPSSAVLGGSSR